MEALMKRKLCTQHFIHGGNPYGLFLIFAILKASLKFLSAYLVLTQKNLSQNFPKMSENFLNYKDSQF